MSWRWLASSTVFVCLAALGGFDGVPRALGAEPPSPSNDASAWQAELGVLPIYWPVYEGADTFETIAFPYFHAEYAGRYFLDVIDGLGIYLLRDERFEAAASLLYEQGREESDDDALDGLGTIDGGPAIRLAGEYRMGKYSVGASLVDQVSGDETGLLLKTDAAYRMTLANRWVVKPALIASITDEAYAEAYFGVDEAQSTASGIATYRPSGGIKSAGLQADLLYFFSPTWSFIGQLKLERLLGDVADSPIVVDENQYTVAVAVAYRLR